MTIGTPYDVEVVNMCKSFGANRVLKGVSFTVAPGEFIGLMGPNGAGKSTLIKILAGVYDATSGEIRLGGRQVRSLADNPSVGFIHQDLGLVDGLTIAENLSLGRRGGKRFGVLLNKKSEYAHARRALDLIGLRQSPNSLISDLTPGEKTLVAVARVMDRGASILVIDEATSTLAPSDAKRVIGSLAAAVEGGATVIMVTHKLAEILDSTSRVVVLLDGELVRDAPTAGLVRGALVDMLMQHESDVRGSQSPKGPAGAAEPVLELQDVKRGSVGPLNFTLNAGEVVGLSGLPGSGLHDVAFLVHGTTKPKSGKVIKRRVGATCALVPPHRESQGGFGELTIQENMAVSSLPRWRSLTGALRPRREKNDCAATAAELDVKPHYMGTPYEVLSGGNKQKVIFGRAILSRPDVYVLCEPTRGVDVGTRSEIYRLIRELTDAGSAVLVASSDAEDLFAVCDRVALVVDGKMQPLRPIAELTESQLELMV